MKKNFPSPIMKRIVLLLVCAVGIVAIGALWSTIYQDHTMRMLSQAACFAISIKAITLYRTAKMAEYEIYEGTIQSRQVLPLQKKQELTIGSGDEMHSLILSGRTQLQIGAHYRLYVESQRAGVKELDLPQRFLPGRSLLGYERMDPATGAKK